MGTKHIVAAFDFDGTLTTRDTLVDFIAFVFGKTKTFWGLLRMSPAIILMKLGLRRNWAVKQELFTLFFKGMPYSEFQKYGRSYANRIDKIIRLKGMNILKCHLNRGDEVFVVTASIENWVAPWCHRVGIKYVIGTQVEEDGNGNLTGRFLSKNCYGPEKVNRLLRVKPERDAYVLYAYGDSRGDKEMIEFADKGQYIN